MRHAGGDSGAAWGCLGLPVAAWGFLSSLGWTGMGWAWLGWIGLGWAGLGAHSFLRGSCEAHHRAGPCGE